VTAIAMHPAPRWIDVVREQVLAVGLRVRAMGLLLIGSLALYAGVAIRVSMNQRVSPLAHGRHAFTDFGFTPQTSMILAYLALLLPAVMWHDEKPSHRMYHLSMPVRRSTHALTKVVAGWVWLMAAAALFVAVVIVVDSVTRRIIGPAAAAPADLASWEWFVPFTAVTVAYALSSAAAIGTETPAVWVVGPPILYVCASLAVDLLGYPHFSQSMLKLFSGFYGAGAAMGGTVEGGVDSMGRLLAPSVGRWIGATALWGAAAGALLYVVARRRSVAR